jgi:membrane protease YdiL (CAAX protease family)
MDSELFFSQWVLLGSGLSPYVKIVIFFVLWGFLWLPLAIPVAIAVKWQFAQMPTPQQKLPLILSLYLVAPFLLWGASRLENQPFSIYGFALTVALGLSILLGIGIGLIGLAILLGLETHQGWITWQPDKKQALVGSLGPVLLLALLVSCVEELVFRGFLVNQFQQADGLWGTAIASSFLFAILHGVWEGRSVAPQLPGLWLLGMVLVLARWVDDGSLGLAIGLHAGWVWGLASLDISQILNYRDDRPLWLTGLGGNPLAGVMGVLLLLITAGAIWALDRFTSTV